ncbi:MAG TPA: carotenoid oxygenase family protein [Steroidobacteraceae bacterium]|nr:carotenoid oxygenase family protein [Steroidobacteraceae bacterium]
MIEVPKSLHGFNQPMRFEADVFDCEVIGRIPSDFTGAYVRVGPEFYFPQKFEDDGAVDGDGYINLFRFKGGIVDYKSRWVKTWRWHKDREAHRQLFGKYRNPFTDDPSIREQTLARPYLRSSANTHTLAHAGKLFALKEDSLPWQMDPKTLDTLGTWNFHGKYDSQTFSAHNKIDPLTGELLAYGYEATGLCSPDLWVYTLDRAGQVTRQWKLQVPQVSMIHDMAATQKHFIFPMGPYVTSIEWLKAGNCHWGWDPSKPSIIGILPRDGEAKDVRWFKGKARAMVHILNAKTEGNIVTLYAAHVDGAFIPFMPYFKSVDGSPLKGSGALFRKYTFDLGSTRDSYEEEVLWEVPVQDIARIDTRYMTLPNRYAFSGYNDASKPFDAARAGNIRNRVTNSYCRFDLETRKVSSYFAGDVHSLQESCFVPRRNGKAEGDGYLIGVANNYAEMRSELIIADAQHLEDGDVARVILPFRSSGLHGLWIGDDEVDFG